RQGGTITAVLRPPQDIDSSPKAVRGDLASLLGVSRKPPASTRKAQVIYGNQSVRSVSRLKPATSGPPQASGLFNLPGSQDLVSAWVLAAIERQMLQASHAQDSPQGQAGLDVSEE